MRADIRKVAIDAAQHISNEMQRVIEAPTVAHVSVKDEISVTLRVVDCMMIHSVMAEIYGKWL